MRKPRLLSLCSGIGAIDLAAVIAGCEIAGQVEIDPFGQDVLLKNFGDLPRRADIKEVATYDAETLTSIFGDIDIVAGGIPCQPFSSAGKRRGVEDDRHLWPYAFAIIKKCQPTWVLIENVRNFATMALDLVLSDLESAKYEARAIILPACAIGAPHIRERCFVLAYLSGERSGSWRAESAGQQGQSNTHCNSAANIVAYPGSARWQEQYAPTISGEVGHVARRNLAPGNRMADTQHRRCERGMLDAIQPGATLLCGGTGAGTKLESGVGRDAHGTACGLDGHIWPALPGEAQRPQEPPRTITGKQPNRNKRLKALGNAVVWQQVYPFFAFITQQYAAHL